MYGFRILGLFALIPVSLLLTVSFFILFALRKTEVQGLKAFGYVTAALVWVAALLVFSSGVYIISTGRPPMPCMMQNMMAGKMPGMMGQHRQKTVPQGQEMMRNQTDMPPMRH